MGCRIEVFRRAGGGVPTDYSRRIEKKTVLRFAESLSISVSCVKQRLL
jgi:hypothetical protein